METTRIWLETRWKLSHTNTAQMALSMCSSRYCSTFAHLFLYFWTIIVFWGSLTLSFYFLIFFFTKEHKRSNHRKYKLKQAKAMAYGKFRRCVQNWHKACDHKNRILWPVFGQIKFSEPSKPENVLRVLVLVAGLFPFEVPDVLSDVNSRKMVRNKAEISTRKHSSNGALYVLL